MNVPNESGWILIREICTLIPQMREEAKHVDVLSEEAPFYERHEQLLCELHCCDYWCPSRGSEDPYFGFSPYPRTKLQSSDPDRDQIDALFEHVLAPPFALPGRVQAKVPCFTVIHQGKLLDEHSRVAANGKTRIVAAVAHQMRAEGLGFLPA